MEEYLRVKVGALGHALSASRLFHAFAMATPGMRELLSIGKVWELAQLQRQTRGAAPVRLRRRRRAGHRARRRDPQDAADVRRHRSGRADRPAGSQDRGDDRRPRRSPGVVAVATPEEMPVNETLVLDEAVRADGPRARRGRSSTPCTRSGSTPTRPPSSSARSRGYALPRSRAALRAALSEHARASTQREQVPRLRESWRLAAGRAALPVRRAARAARARAARRPARSRR